MKRKRALQLIVLMLVSMVSLCTSAPAGGRSWALIVGIDQYEDSEITPLRFAEADAQAIAAALVRDGSFTSDQVIVLTSRGPGRLRASRPNLIGWLVRLQANVKPTDTFFFFFSGHGMSMEKQSYLLTADAVPEPVENLEMSALRMGDLRRLLEKIPAAHKLIAVDACRSDPRAGRGNVNNPMQESFARDLAIRARNGATAHDQVVATLYACQIGQRSYEWPERKQGFFSYFLTRGLLGEARNTKGVVTLNSLLEYLETKVPEQVRLWKGSDAQTPWAEVVGTGASRWVLTSPKGAVAAAPAPTIPADEPARSASPTSNSTPNPSPAPSASAPSVATVPVETPAAPAPSPPQRPLLDRAQEAFNAGHFIDPPGENAVELSKQVLDKDPGNSFARSLRRHALEEVERKAKQAKEMNDLIGAIDKYARLLEVWPERPDLRQEYDYMKTMDQAGEWSTSASLLFFSAQGKLTSRRDGTYTRWDNWTNQTVEGKWRCTSIADRTFHVEDRLCVADIKMSTDGQRMEGAMSSGARLIVTRVRAR